MATKVVVAIDDPSIGDAVAPLDVETVLTSQTHQSGTARVAEVAALPRFQEYDMLLNVQADEPFVAAEAILGAIERVQRGEAIGTAGAPLTALALADRDKVKVVVNRSGRAVRFARELHASALSGRDDTVLQHIGIYAFTRTVLLRWMKLPPVSEEQSEQLEQLRPMRYGLGIGVAATAALAGPSVDTWHDLERAEAYMERHGRKVRR